MGGSAAGVPREGVALAPEDVWAAEIRDYLLGRLASPMQVGALPAVHEVALTHAPIRRWWIFEGKRYRTLDGPLAENWQAAVDLVARLLRTYNPRLRISDRPDGFVDWGQTLARGVMQFRQEYVVRATGTGLGEDEYAALRGWMSWMLQEWQTYSDAVGTDLALEWGLPGPPDDGPFTDDRLRRWAHTTRRSRWPFLRDVVAESLRPVLESEELDRIPLPSDRAKLLELVCLIRIARTVSSPPRELRWLDAALTNNVLRLEGMTCYYQQSLPRERVITPPEYSEALALAVDAFKVGIPKYVDLAFDFDSLRSGFAGLIVEVKSGSQKYSDAVGQLRTYRAARPRKPGSRYIVWGITEAPDVPTLTVDELRKLTAAAPHGEDLWLFSGADGIATVLKALFGGTDDSATVTRTH